MFQQFLPAVLWLHTSIFCYHAVEYWLYIQAKPQDNISHKTCNFGAVMVASDEIQSKLLHHLLLDDCKLLQIVVIRAVDFAKKHDCDVAISMSTCTIFFNIY